MKTIIKAPSRGKQEYSCYIYPNESAPYLQPMVYYGHEVDQLKVGLVLDL